MLATLPPFELLERSGRPVTLETLRGRTFVADFIFTRCTGICPAMTARMARLRAELPAAVRLVSFTVDPEYDTPEVLSRYAQKWGATEDWLFLTGPPDALERLASEGFRLGLAPDPAADGDAPLVHSPRFVLVDGLGRVRGYYDSADETAMKSLVADARRLGTAR